MPPAPVGTRAEAEVPELAVQIRRDGARPLVAVSGDLDLTGQELLEAVLAHVRASGARLIEVDLAGVTFADTHGLAPALGRDVVLVSASPPVTRLLRLLGVPVPRSRPLRRALGRWSRGSDPG
jgi:anti-anti-sigma regulatory factor